MLWFNGRETFLHICVWLDGEHWKYVQNTSWDCTLQCVFSDANRFNSVLQMLISFFLGSWIPTTFPSVLGYLQNLFIFPGNGLYQFENSLLLFAVLYQTVFICFLKNFLPPSWNEGRIWLIIAHFFTVKLFSAYRWSSNISLVCIILFFLNVNRSNAAASDDGFSSFIQPCPYQVHLSKRGLLSPRVLIFLVIPLHWHLKWH